MGPSIASISRILVKDATSKGVEAPTEQNPGTEDSLGSARRNLGNTFM